ncbi:sulfite exporter TauE/SafE family protein [Sulfurivermis fontis]|jgi:sulfite exporter TauE/SafE|uniref:sulfite exporter TauE/SafE family protein n=1 Tax=Sulfurivermis fontis TaxID=1972068 RepID=UPI000FDC400E|nr:sulfite exporter TauE/SafE family protein [Sulfurivermis fontis]
MNGEFTYALAFMTGLLGAGHCLGMCSGLAGGLAVHQSHWRKPLPLLGYHGSRIAVYVVLGALGAALGRTLVQTGALGKFQGQLIILAGAVIIVLGLGIAGLLPKLAPRRCPPGTPSQPPHRMARWHKQLAPIIAGVVNGLVPCSLVFSVALRATATADPMQAGLLMLCFGLGTLPAMGAVTALSGHIGCRAHGIAQRLAGVAVIALGAWTVYEGVIFYQVMSGLAN